MWVYERAFLWKHDVWKRCEKGCDTKQQQNELCVDKETVRCAFGMRLVQHGQTKARQTKNIDLPDFRHHIEFYLAGACYTMKRVYKAMCEYYSLNSNDDYIDVINLCTTYVKVWEWEWEIQILSHDLNHWKWSWIAMVRVSNIILAFKWFETKSIIDFLNEMSINK